MPTSFGRPPLDRTWLACSVGSVEGAGRGEQGTDRPACYASTTRQRDAFEATHAAGEISPAGADATAGVTRTADTHSPKKAVSAPDAVARAFG